MLACERDKEESEQGTGEGEVDLPFLVRIFKFFESSLRRVSCRACQLVFIIDLPGATGVWHGGLPEFTSIYCQHTFSALLLFFHWLTAFVLTFPKFGSLLFLRVAPYPRFLAADLRYICYPI